MEKENNQIFKSVILIAKGISETLGSNCEVVVHDLSHPKTSIIAIFNNVITERKVGDGIRDLVLNVLRSPDFKEDILANYQTIAHKGKVIKSTTILIRDQNNKPIGALCLNFDLSQFYNLKKVVEEFTRINKLCPSEEKVIEINNADIINVLDYIISQTIQETGIPLDEMSKDERIKIIRFLDEKGVFKVKGATNWVAERLKVSVPTVYSYLNIIRNQNDMKKILD